MSRTVSEALVAFMQEYAEKGVPDRAFHETKRLILNQLKASVGAHDHPAVTILRNWAELSGSIGKAHILWHGDAVSAESAAVVNGALFEVLDFNDTHIPTYQHAVSGVLPAVLALAEVDGHSGRDVVNALAIGIEVELAVATILIPTAYYRGFVPGGLTGGVGAAAACAVLAGLTTEQMRNALGLAMVSAFGLYASVGSMGLPYVMGMTARSGLNAVEIASLGMTAPSTAFEGDKGMLESHSDESPDKIAGVLAQLGSTWRVLNQTYKTVPTETITHAPLECLFQILPRINGRSVARIELLVEPIVVKIANERMERFGKPSSDLTARFDTRFCVASALKHGEFTLTQMMEAAYTDTEILAMREKIELIPDPKRPTFDGCSMRVHFTDGTTEFANVDYFVGTPGNPMKDEQLSDVFRRSARNLLPASRIDEILEAVWALDTAPNVQSLTSLLTFKSGDSHA